MTTNVTAHSRSTRLTATALSTCDATAKYKAVKSPVLAMPTDRIRAPRPYPPPAATIGTLGEGAYGKRLYTRGHEAAADRFARRVRGPRRGARAASWLPVLDAGLLPAEGRPELPALRPVDRLSGASADLQSRRRAGANRLSRPRLPLLPGRRPPGVRGIHAPAAGRPGARRCGADRRDRPRRRAARGPPGGPVLDGAGGALACAGRLWRFADLRAAVLAVADHLAGAGAEGAAVRAMARLGDRRGSGVRRRRAHPAGLAVRAAGGGADRGARARPLARRRRGGARGRHHDRAVDGAQHPW